MTNAMPLDAGTCVRNCSKASSPPAEAPMPTMGNDTLAGEAGVVSPAALAGVLGRRSGLDFVSMILFAIPAAGGRSAPLRHRASWRTDRFRLADGRRVHGRTDSSIKRILPKA